MNILVKVQEELLVGQQLLRQPKPNLQFVVRDPPSLSAGRRMARQQLLAAVAPEFEIRSINYLQVEGNQPQLQAVIQRPRPVKKATVGRSAFTASGRRRT